MLQIDMHLIGTPMLTKFYSYKSGCYMIGEQWSYDAEIMNERYMRASVTRTHVGHHS
jgi:hypothetical protein